MQNNSFRILAVICVLLLGLIIYTSYHLARSNANAQTLAEEVCHLKMTNDSLNSKMQIYNGLFVFDELEVRSEGAKSKISIGDTAKALVYVVSSLTQDWDYLPRHRIVYWIGEEQQFDPDTLVVDSLVNVISYTPMTSKDTVVQGFYEIQLKNRIVKIPFKIKTELHLKSPLK